VGKQTSEDNTDFTVGASENVETTFGTKDSVKPEPISSWNSHHMTRIAGWKDQDAAGKKGRQAMKVACGSRQYDPAEVGKIGSTLTLSTADRNGRNPLTF